MYFLLAVLILSYISMCNANSDEKFLTKSEQKLLELKVDVDRIEDGFENLAFDIVKQVINGVHKLYQVNGQYYVSEDNISDEATIPQPVTQKMLTNFLENTTEEYTTQTFVTLSTNDEGSSRASLENVSENQTEVYSKNRRERSVEDNNFSNNPSQNSKGKSLDESSNCSKNFCSDKTQQDQALEHQHIEDLKEEVKKLYDLVVLLRDQQKIMSLLNVETKDLDSDLSQRFDAKDLIKIVNRVNNKDASSLPVHTDKKTNNSASARMWNETSASDITKKKSISEELDKIKHGLKAVVNALNKTKEILTMERGKEISLENEIRDQREELALLKIMVEKLYENNTSFSNISNPKEGNLTVHTGEILGTPLHLPKQLLEEREKEVVKMPGVDKKTNGIKAGTSNARDGNVIRESSKIKHRSRSSDFEDIERLLDKIRKPKKDDIESRMFELKQETDKKKKEEDLIKQAMLLQKFLAQQKEGLNLKGFSSDDSAMLKRLQEAIKNAPRPQNKAVDDEVELQLQKLQIAIENLTPRDDWEVGQDGTEKEQFRKLLSRLLSQDSKDEEINVAEGNRAEHLSPKQIAELKKLLDQLNYAGVKVTEGNMFSTGNGCDYGPQFAGSLSGNYVCKTEEFPQSNSDINSSDLFGRGPLPQFFSGGFSNFPPSYLQYPVSTNSVLNNGMFSMPGNSQFGRYYPLAGNMPHADLRHFVQNADFGPTPLDQNHFGTGVGQNVYQKPYEIPIQSNQNNFGIDMEQNFLRGRSHFLPRDFGMSTPRNFGNTLEQHQSSSRFHQIPFMEPIPQRQYKIGSSTVSELHETPFTMPTKQSVYQSPSNLPQIPYDMSVVPNSKPFDRYLRPIPYSQSVAGEQNYQQKGIKDEFFPAPQSTPDAFYSQINAGGGSTDQSGAYPRQNSENVDYRHQKIEDIKTQVESLQNVIANLNKPDYIQKAENNEIMGNLERQINELKDITRGLNEEMASTQQSIPNLPGYDQNGTQQHLQRQLNYPTSLNRSRREFIKGSHIDVDENSKLYDDIFKLSQLMFDKENQTKERSNYYDDTQKRIVDLKSQLEKHLHTSRIGHEHHFNPSYSTDLSPNSYQPPYLHYDKQYPTISLEPKRNEFIQPKKNNLFTSIIIKIFDGLLAATPAVIEKVFGDGLTQLTNFGDFSTYGDYYGDDSNVLTLFKSLGKLAYGPLILLKIVDGLITFVNILRRNKFFKNIFLPVLILLLVAGSVLFLTWWLQPNQEQYVTIQHTNDFGKINYNKYYEHPNSNYQNLNGYNNVNKYAAIRTYGYPIYSRSYFENGQ